MVFFPNSKINIGLNILSKRSDGYHEISSIFYPLKSCCDILEITEQKSFDFVTTGIKIPSGENLCERAYKIIKKDFDIPNVLIHLHKKIPIGAGMGGGSSDGAFTLLGLNKLFDLGISLSELKNYALKLGADCPFFIFNTPAYIQGIGDIITSIDLNLDDYTIKFVDPGIPISTYKAYKDILPKSSDLYLSEIIDIPLIHWRYQVKNDFEDIIFKTHPELRKLKETFYTQGAIYSSMTGSGSVIYGIFQK